MAKASLLHGADQGFESLLFYQLRFIMTDEEFEKLLEDIRNPSKRKRARNNRVAIEMMAKLNEQARKKEAAQRAFLLKEDNKLPWNLRHYGL